MSDVARFRDLKNVYFLFFLFFLVRLQVAMKFEEMIDRIDVPLVLIYGKEDPWVVPLWGHRIKRQRPETLYYEVHRLRSFCFLCTIKRWVHTPYVLCVGEAKDVSGSSLVVGKTCHRATGAHWSSFS